jgi:hypothetical protein
MSSTDETPDVSFANSPDCDCVILVTKSGRRPCASRSFDYHREQLCSAKYFIDMPIDIREQATDNLRFIRGAMERAERVSSASGAGAMVMGGIALCTMALAAGLDSLTEQLMLWIGAAVLAVIAGAAGSWLKARKQGLVLLGDPGRRFLLCLIPALVVGVVLTASLWRTEQIGLLPAFWMMLYGCGVLAAGTYAAAPIMQMGGCFAVAGLFTHALPTAWSNVLLGAVFGGLHLYFGYRVYRHHGG